MKIWIGKWATKLIAVGKSEIDACHLSSDHQLVTDYQGLLLRFDLDFKNWFIDAVIARILSFRKIPAEFEVEFTCSKSFTQLKVFNTAHVGQQYWSVTMEQY